MARRKPPPAPDTGGLVVPSDLLAGPSIDVWCRDPHDAEIDNHGFLVAGYVMCLVARRRFRAARTKWAEENGLDRKAMFKLIPDRHPSGWERSK